MPRCRSDSKRNYVILESCSHPPELVVPTASPEGELLYDTVRRSVNRFWLVQNLSKTTWKQEERSRSGDRYDADPRSGWVVHNDRARCTTRHMNQLNNVSVCILTWEIYSLAAKQMSRNRAFLLSELSRILLTYDSPILHQTLQSFSYR